MVHCTQCADDHRWHPGDRLSIRGWDSRHPYRGMAVALQRGAAFVFAFRGGGVAGVVWELLLAVVYALVGFYILANPGIALATLTLVIAIYLFVEALLEFAEAYMTRHESGSGWLLFDGIVTLVLAFMIWATWPSSKIW